MTCACSATRRCGRWPMPAALEQAVGQSAPECDRRQPAGRAGDWSASPATATEVAIDDHRQGLRHGRRFHPQPPVPAVRLDQGGGFGIGAFEARSLVAAMGGRLTVDSRPGKGSQLHHPPPRRRSRRANTHGNSHDRPAQPIFPSCSSSRTTRACSASSNGPMTAIAWSSPATAASAIERAAAARAGGRHARPRPSARSRRHRAKASPR